MPKSTSAKKTKGGPSKKGRKRSKKGKAKVKAAPMKKRRAVKYTFPKFVFSGFYKPSRRIGEGGVLPKTRALGRLIRWPKYVKLQRQRKVLMQRIVIPPALNMFNLTAPKPLAGSLIKLFKRYKPETRKAKRDRLRAQAVLEADGKELSGKKPIILKSGFNHVTDLIERGQAKLVLIASDVDPIELVLWMPTLCVKKDVPFAIIRGQARLGTLVNQRSTTCVCLCDVRPPDATRFKALQGQCKMRYNNRFNALRNRKSQRVLGFKTRNRILKRQKERAAEAKKRKQALKESGATQ